MQQQSGFNQYINKVRFINRYTGWMCGDAGFISKTTNGGTNWIQQINPATDKLLTAIFPVDVNIVYCVGYFETILKTTNGGLNWIALSNGPIGLGNSNFGIFFLNAQVGWIISALGRVFKTTNGGFTFDSVFITGGGYLRDIYFKDMSTGLICGESAQMYKSTTGGINWYNINVPIGFEAAHFYSFTFINNQLGWTVGLGNNKVYKTTNFGDSWDSLVRIQSMTLSFSIFFSSAITGWIGGFWNGTNTAAVYKSTNSGLNWILENTGNIPSSFTTIYFYSDSVGWAAGQFGKIVHTTNGGQPAAITKLETNVPEGFKLHQNHPNPFNSQTNIEFEIPEGSNISVKLYNVLGKLIDNVLEQYVSAGRYRINYNASALNSGAYFYTLNTGNTTLTRKLILIK